MSTTLPPDEASIPLPALYEALRVAGCDSLRARLACEEVYALHPSLQPRGRSWSLTVLQILVAAALLALSVYQWLR